jgi:hypothetical protein
VLGGPIVYPFEAAREVFDTYREFAASAPDDVFPEFGLMPLPDGSSAAYMFLFHAGPLDEAERALEPLRRFREPLEDLLAPRPYVEVQQMFDEALPAGVNYFWKSSDVHELSDGVIETLLERYAERPERAIVIVDQYGGAVGRVPDDATAFGHRRSAFAVIVIAMWDDPAQEEAHVTWARGLWDALQPHAENAVYVNYLGPDDAEDRIREQLTAEVDSVTNRALTGGFRGQGALNAWRGIPRPWICSLKRFGVQLIRRGVRVDQDTYEACWVDAGRLRGSRIRRRPRGAPDAWPLGSGWQPRVHRR